MSADVVAEEYSFLRWVLDKLQHQVSYLDESLVYRQCNTAAAATVGLTPDQIVGRPAQSIVGAESEVFKLLKGVIETGESYCGVVEFTQPGSTARSHYRASYIPHFDEQGRIKGVLTDVVDVPELIEAQPRMEQRLQDTELLQELTTVATGSLSLPEIGKRVLRLMHERLGLKAATLYTVDDTAGVLRALAIIGPDEDVAAGAQVVAIDDETTHGRIVYRRLPIITHESNLTVSEITGSRLRSAVGTAPARWVLLPVKKGEDILGVTGLFFEGDRPFGEEELSLYRSMAELLGSAFANARSYERVMHSERRFHALFRTMAEGSCLCEIILDDEGVPCDIRYLEINAGFEKQTGMVAADTIGRTWGELFPGFEKTETELLMRYGDVALTGTPDHWEAPFGRLGGYYEVSVYQTAPGRFAAVFFDITERTKLHESTNETARLSEALNAANATVHSSLDIDQVMRRSLQTGASVLDCEAAAVMILDGDGWILRHEHGLSARDIDRHLSKDETPTISLAAERGTAVAIDDMSADKDHYTGFAKRYALKSALAVPLVAKGALIGCTVFYTSSAVKRFTAAEIDFGRKLGSAVSLALENARLFGTEHHIAQILQKALLTLPDSIPGITFANSYSSATAATEVGGDFYDIFEVDHDRIGITIGDMSGKGLEAAVLTSLVKNTIRAYASEKTKTPTQVLTQANEVVYKSTPSQVFATVFFAILDRRNGRLLYANAGHTAAALTKDDGTFVRLTPTGPFLGAFPDVTYSGGEARLKLDDLLFLYTDGLTEARRGDEFYGEERLFAFLSTTQNRGARQTVDSVLADVTSFAGNRLHDDLAILALRRLEEQEDH